MTDRCDMCLYMSCNIQRAGLATSNNAAAIGAPNGSRVCAHVCCLSCAGCQCGVVVVFACVLVRACACTRLCARVVDGMGIGLGVMVGRVMADLCCTNASTCAPIGRCCASHRRGRTRSVPHTTSSVARSMRPSQAYADCVSGTAVHDRHAVQEALERACGTLFALSVMAWAVK